MSNLGSLIGLPSEKAKAITQIRGCLANDLLFPHTLLTGIGGCGKTAFARSIGVELGYFFVEVEAIVFKTREQIQEFLISSSSKATNAGTSKEWTLLLFIDEIHRLSLPLQEALYVPMKEWRVSTRKGDRQIAPFTLIGATTRFDLLDSNSFVTRFDNHWELERYSEGDIGLIVAQEFRKLNLHFSRDSVLMIAKRCLGIPRYAISFVQKLRFSARDSCVSFDSVRAMFELEEIDDFGLQPIHRRYLRILQESRCNGSYAPLGVGAIASKMRQPEDMIKGAVEPILLEFGMISPTPRGRILTKSGEQFLDRKFFSEKPKRSLTS